MSIFLDTQDRQAIAAAQAAARAREAEIARQQAEAKAKAEAAAKARAEAAAKAKAEAEAKAKAEAAAKAQAARNRPLFMIPMANPTKPPFIGPVAPQKNGLLFMAPAATPPKPGQPGFIGPVAVKPDPAQANAAFRAQERKDAQDAERKSPTSMTSAMEETRSARAEVDKALKADSNKGSKETRTALESATARYGEAMQQQVRIATWQAQTRGEDDKGVKKAIEEQANAASEIGNDGGPNEMKPLAKMVADIGKEEWANQRNADVRAVQIEQVGTLRSVDPEALQAKAETDAQRVKDLQGAPGYAQESAQKQAKQSALEYAQVVAKNDGFVTKAADLLLKDAGVALSQAQIKGDPIATAAAQKDYDQKFEAAKQASTQAELSQGMATALQADQDASAAQKAYLDAHPGMPSGGYALLPPSDLKQKILDGNSKTAGDAGTQGDGDGIYKLSNGSRVQRLSDGQWKVLDVGKDIEPGIKKNQMLDPLTAKVWETQYQAAKSSVALDSAWTYANRQLPQAADGSQPQMPTATADLSGQLAADKKAVQDAEALAKIQGPFTNQAIQKNKDDLEIAKAKLELTDQLIQWQKTDKEYQAAKRNDDSQMCMAKTDEQYRDITDDAFVRVQRAQANLELAQSKAVTGQAKVALDATPQYAPAPAGAKPAIPPMIAAPTLNNLATPAAGTPFIGPVQKGATPPLLLAQPQPQVPTAEWQAANDRYNQAVQAQDQGQKKFEQAQGSEFLTSRLSTTELYDAEAVKRALAPPEEKKESHRADSILEAVVGGLEVVGGVALGVTAGWTGVGAVAAAALIADGGTRVVHGVVDAAKDEKTDPYLSQGLQQLGVDQTAANRIDTGVGLTAGLVAGGPGAVKLGVQGIRALNGVRVAGQAGEAFTVAQVAGAGGKALAGAGSTAMLADMSYAQGSYVVTGEMKTPLGTQGLMKMGLSETQANYVQVLGGLGVGAGVSTAKWAAPKVKAATTARNATAGAAATQVVAGQQGATAPGTAPAGTTGTTPAGTTPTGTAPTGTTPTGTTPTGTTPAGTPPAGSTPVNNAPASGNNTAPAAPGNQGSASGSGVNGPDLKAKAGGAHPPARGNVYNDTLVLGNNLSSEKIFQQGAVVHGADTTVSALTAAVSKKGDKASIVIATGRSDAKGVLDAGGPASAAHTGRAMRIYAEKELGARITPTYVVDRQNMPLMRAALDAAGETPDAYNLVTFNARGRWAEGRSRAFTKKHDPDLMVAVDVPGRTGDRQYLNTDGGQITKFNSARDRLFTEAENRGVPTVAALERGHEVGGGAKSVFNLVDPAANGAEIASVVPAGVPVVAGKASWASYALSTELLRRADALDQAPSGKQVRDTVAAVESAGGRSSANTSAIVEGTVAELLKSQAARMGENKPVGPDLRGRTIRVGVFDSGSGGILGADVIKASIEQRTGATVELVPAGDHGAGTYGPKTKTEIADLTRSGLETLEKSDVDLVVMACNTACTSGKPQYARGIQVPVIDLIASTREYHQTLVGQGKKVVAFSTEATAKLELPDSNPPVKIYEDTHVTPVGGTDGPILNDKKVVTNPKEVAAYDARWAEFRAEYEQRTGSDMSKVAGIDQSDLNLANLVNRYLPDKASPELTARLEFAADHYVDKILKTAPDADTISWCCTHYPELKPFVQKALDARGKGSIEMVNPMEFHALKAIDELAVQPPGVGISRGGTVAITTAVPDKNLADPSIPQERRTTDMKDVADTVPVVIQQPERPIVGLPRFGRDVDNTPVLDALNNLNRNTIDELRAYDPPGRARSIIISDSPAFAADQLMQSQKPMVVTGSPVQVGRGNKFKPDSDGIKGAAEMASALRKLGKDPVVVTSDAGVAAMKAALQAHGHDDIQVVGFGHRASDPATAKAADNLLQKHGVDSVVGIEVAGRDAAGKYWGADGQALSKVPALDEMFLAAERRNGGAAPGQKIPTIAILDRGNEAGAGKYPSRVPEAASGQKITSVVSADTVVTSGVSSWGASSVVATLESVSGKRGLLTDPAAVNKVMHAIADNGAVDSMTGQRGASAMGYSPLVHQGMAELFQKAAAEPPGTKAATPKGPTTTPPSAGTPLPGKPAKTTTGGVPVNEAAFTGRDWPSLWKRLSSRDIIDGDGTAYVYQVKPKSGAQAFDGVSAQSFGKDEIAGWGRVAGGTSTVRWYGRTNPGQGLMGMLPRGEMASKLGAQQDLTSVGWMLKDRTTGKVIRTTTPPSAEVLADTNIRVTRALARGPKEANVQPNDTYFVVSNRSPQEVMAAGGLREVPLGDTQFKVATAASAPKLPTGWSRARSLKVQAGLTLVAMGGSFGLHAMGFDYGNKVPDGAYGLPPNPLASGQGAPQPEEDALVRDLSPAARTALASARTQQQAADKLRMDPAADKAAADAAQAKADKEWTTFSKESESLIQQDVKAGKSAFESANAIRNGLKQDNSLDATSDAAVQLALRTSGKLTGGEADVKAALEYAALVAKDPAFVNDPARRPLAQRDPLGFARATLMEQGVLSKDYTQAVDASIEKVGQQQASKSIIAKLLADDVVGAGKQARLALDAMPNDAARKRVAAELAPLFEGEREHALNALKDKPLSDKGDYLMQYRDAPPEVAQPMAKAVADRFGDFSSQMSLQGAAGGADFIAGLSTLAQAADARSATPEWSERFATELTKPGATPLSPAVLRDGARQAVEAGQAKLATELANALDKQVKDQPTAAAARDAVLEGATDGLKKQQEHLKEAIGNLTGEAGVNAAGSSLAYYVQNFGGSTPESQAAAVRDYRRINPEVAYNMDQAERVIGERGAALYAINQDLKGLNIADRSKGAALGLDKENANLFSEDPNAPSDAEVAMGQSAQLRQELLSRAKQNVPEPRTMIESIVNPTMFITRHISGTTRMTWTLAADANFNAMVADPESFPKRWDALKVRTEKMALSMGVPPDEAKKGIKVVDDYLAAVKGIDPALPDAQKAEKLAKAYADLDKGIKGVSGVGAKTVYNVANAHTPFGQTLRWVANAGFITHNISTPITNFRPMLDNGAIDSASGASRIYQATQPPFVLKAYTAAQQNPGLASKAIQAGRAADPEGLLPWKFTFGAGTLGVGIADTALGVVQYKKVPDWVTFTNYGMGVSGIVDGGTGLWNTTAGVLAKNGAVELGAKTIASEIGTIGGYGVALFTGIKSGYNIIHYYDKVDAREAQRDPALKNVLLARGFTETQTKTLLDASTAGESPMVALNAAFARQGMTREQGLAWLKKNFTDEALAAKPGYQDGVDAANTLLANHLNQNTGELPDTDPEAAHAGELRYSPTGVEMRRTPDSVEGLVTYLERFYGPLNAEAAMAPAKSEMKVPKPGTAPPVNELPLPPITNGDKPPYISPLAPMRTITVDSNSIATGSLEGIAYSNRQHLPDQDALKKAADRGALALRIEALQQLVQINPLREFDLSRLDGVVAARPKGDPDYLEDGWQINVGRR